MRPVLTIILCSVAYLVSVVAVADRAPETDRSTPVACQDVDTAPLALNATPQPTTPVANLADLGTIPAEDDDPFDDDGADVRPFVCWSSSYGSAEAPHFSLAPERADLVGRSSPIRC
jgi:hypothetical protein